MRVGDSMTQNTQPPTEDEPDAATRAKLRDAFVEGYAAGALAMEARGPLDPFLTGEDYLLDLLGDVPVPRPANGEPTL